MDFTERLAPVRSALDIKKSKNLIGTSYVMVPNQSQIIRIALKDIVRLEGIRNYTLFHLVNGRNVISSRTLKTYEDVLAGNNFLRIHKAHLINIDCLLNYDESELTFAVMNNKDRIAISRRKRKCFQEKMRIAY
jgi:two-component system LytT family response regulator